MGTREWTEMIEKEELIVGEINMGQGPISPVPVDAGIVPIPENHVDARPFPFPRIVSTLRPFTLTQVYKPGFRLPRGATTTQRRYGCYEPCLT